MIESTSPTTSLQLVSAGLGIGIVPDVALLHHSTMQMGSVRQLPVAPEPHSSAVALIYRAGAFNPRVDLLKAALKFHTAY